MSLVQNMLTDGLLSTPDTVGFPSNATTTKWSTIRDRLVSIIQALTPTRRSDETFRWLPRAGVEFREEQPDFDAYAEAHDDTVFRGFDIVQIGWEPGGGNDGITQVRQSSFELTLAYPHHYAGYGDDNSGELMDYLEEDLSKIGFAIGLNGQDNWHAASTPISEAFEFEVGEGVTYGRMIVDFQYYFDTSA